MFWSRSRVGQKVMPLHRTSHRFTPRQEQMVRTYRDSPEDLHIRIVFVIISPVKLRTRHAIAVGTPVARRPPLIMWSWTRPLCGTGGLARG